MKDRAQNHHTWGSVSSSVNSDFQFFLGPQARRVLLKTSRLLGVQGDLHIVRCALPWCAGRARSSYSHGATAGGQVGWCLKPPLASETNVGFCLKCCANPYSSRGLLTSGARFPRPRPVSRTWLGVPFKVTTLRRGSFKAKMLSFRIILNHFKPKAAQTTKWSVVAQRLSHFVPKAAQMVHMMSCHPDVPNQFWWHFELFPFGSTAFSSNGFNSRVVS